jgi:hypothetical protein
MYTDEVLKDDAMGNAAGGSGAAGKHRTQRRAD